MSRFAGLFALALTGVAFAPRTSFAAVPCGDLTTLTLPENTTVSSAPTAGPPGRSCHRAPRRLRTSPPSAGSSAFRGRPRTP